MVEEDGGDVHFGIHTLALRSAGNGSRFRVEQCGGGWRTYIEITAPGPFPEWPLSDPVERDGHSWRGMWPIA